jgi:hypothetical protein
MIFQLQHQLKHWTATKQNHQNCHLELKLHENTAVFPEIGSFSSLVITANKKWLVLKKILPNTLNFLCTNSSTRCSLKKTTVQDVSTSEKIKPRLDMCSFHSKKNSWYLHHDITKQKYQALWTRTLLNSSLKYYWCILSIHALNIQYLHTSVSETQNEENQMVSIDK